MTRLSRRRRTRCAASPVPPQRAPARAARSVGARRRARATVRSPNFAASASAPVGWATERSSPVSPISPKQASGAAPARRQRDAARGARDGERDREVGARLVDPHAADDVDEHVRGADPDAGVAAEHGEHEREAVAVDPVARPAAAARAPTATRAPGPRRAAAASPPSRRARRCPARASPRRRSARWRRATSTRPPVAHLEDADVVRRAEAVLQRAQRAVGALALALELQHAVDEVLEHARAGERALLRDVADEQDRDAARAWRRRVIRVGDLAHLADGARARRRAPRACSVCTESMTHDLRAARRRSVASTASRSVSASTGTSSARGAGRRSARSRICAADSSPET